MPANLENSAVATGLEKLFSFQSQRKAMPIPHHHTCLLRNLYAGQEATVRTGHGTTDCFQISKGVRQGWILSPCLFNVHVDVSSVPFTQSCPTLCDRMDCSTPGFPVQHQLQELTQTHVHRVSDAIQPSHSLVTPSPPAFNISQHQGFSNGSLLCIKVLELQLQHQSFQWLLRTNFL